MCDGRSDYVHSCSQICRPWCMLCIVISENSGQSIIHYTRVVTIFRTLPVLDIPANIIKIIIIILTVVQWHQTIIIIITRLLGRPQPQMYPPVALNQYTLVNRTHNIIYIYASRPHKHLKITPKLNNMQNMEVIWWTFFQIFVFILGGVLGKRMLNPEVLNCHEDIITLDTYVQQGKTMVTMAGDNKFYIYVKILTSLAIWGPGGGGGGVLE